MAIRKPAPDIKRVELCAPGAQQRLGDWRSDQIEKQGFRMRGLQCASATGVFDNGVASNDARRGGLGLMHAIAIASARFAAIWSGSCRGVLRELRREPFGTGVMLPIGSRHLVARSLLFHGRLDGRRVGRRSRVHDRHGRSCMGRRDPIQDEAEGQQHMKPSLGTAHMNILPHRPKAAIRQAQPLVLRSGVGSLRS